MNYPIWDVPFLGSGWVVGIIAIFHVMISHFAVGGGFYLILAEQKARREHREDWLEVLRGHSKFFLILTGVFGAISGVGIWFSIGLASPQSTSALIHNFVFGWAMEWCLFLVEIAAVMVYYYTWDRVDPKTHMRVGWLYAITSWFTLAIINGILTFMLTPGKPWLAVAGTGRESSEFWAALFNPTYWPSLVLRTLTCFALAGVWALVTASRIDGFAKPELKAEVIRWSARWLMPSFFLVPFGLAWYLYAIPDNSRLLLQLGVGTIGPGLFTQIARAALVTTMSSATILAVVYFLAWKNPRDFGLGHAVAVVFLALTATGATEHAREMIRKPYTVGQYMYSNGVRRSEVAHFNQVGFTTSSIWASGSTGELMFRGQCTNCHTLDGYRAIRQLLHGRDKGSIVKLLGMLHDSPANSPYKNYMPPLVGTAGEIDALADYLNKLVNPGGSGAANDAVAQGKTLYDANACGACHGDGGTGGPIAPALLGIGTRMPGEKLTEFLIKPSDKAIAGGMPTPKLSPDEMKQLVAYLDSLK
jgi:cytochrome d ubiquinol oxidase subunit I